MLNVTRGSMKKATIMAWVALVVGTLAIVTAMSTDYWVHRVSDGEHTGIFPCCPTFKCGKLHDSSHIDAFIFMLLPGLILVLVGGVLSVVHAYCTWRRDDKTYYPMSYIVFASIGLGGLVLLAGAILFTATLPNDMEHVLQEDCHTRDYSVETGFSFEIYVTAVVAYILAAVLIYVGSPKRNQKSSRHHHHHHHHHNHNFSRSSRIVVSADTSTNDVPLQTISGQVTSETTSEELTTSTSTPSSEDVQPEVVTTPESGPLAGRYRVRRSHLLPWQRLQDRSRPGVHHSRTRTCHCQFSADHGQHCPIHDGVALPPYTHVQPPSYQEVVILDPPPPYSESEPQITAAEIEIEATGTAAVAEATTTAAVVEARIAATVAEATTTAAEPEPNNSTETET